MKTMKITSWNIKHTSRYGLTLMEILASVFVLSFGLLAVLTILPFGAFQLERMNVADMSGACGRGAIQQIRMAEWQKPENIWVATDGTDNLSGRFFYGTEECQIADPFIVDPLGLNPDNLLGGSSVYHYLNNGSPAVRREFPISVNADRSDCLHVMSVYDNSYFHWSDDTIFASNGEARPELVTRQDGTPSLSGDFTWLYMVTPICDQKKVQRFNSSESMSNLNLPITRYNTLGYTPIDNVTGYEVTAVVFHRRDLYPEPLDVSTGASAPSENQYRPIRRLSLEERTINATGAYIKMTSANADDLDLSSIKWILLTGQSQGMIDDSKGPLIAQWYRVTGSDDIQGPDADDLYSRRVFLVGPDWKGAKYMNTRNPDDPKNGEPDGPVYAILCDGVVNVFQATMPK